MVKCELGPKRINGFAEFIIAVPKLISFAFDLPDLIHCRFWVVDIGPLLNELFQF